MNPLLVASLLLPGIQREGAFPKPVVPSVPNEVRDWKGFGFLPEGIRSFQNALPVPADWSKVQTTLKSDAVPWRTKVVILDRIDRTHERGKGFVWAGHHGTTPPLVDLVKRALEKTKALVANDTEGRVDLRFDVSEEPEALTMGGGDLPALVRRYLTPRVNGGRYEAEDGVFRGPYASILVVHPVGGESDAPIVVQGTPTALVGLPDVEGYDVDGVLATVLRDRWRGLVSLQAQAAGLPFAFDSVERWTRWSEIAPGADAPTDARLRLASLEEGKDGATLIRDRTEPSARGPLGVGTYAKIVKDPVKGSALTYDEVGAYRNGGLVLPWVDGFEIDPAKTPTLAFWMRSDAKDPVVLRFVRSATKDVEGPYGPSVTIGKDVPFAYDGVWHRVRVDLRPRGKGISGIVIGPDRAARETLRLTLGPISAGFADFQTTTEAPDAAPLPEAPGPTATDPEARALWATSAGPGEARRALLKDPVEAVRANAAAAAAAQPDPADEPALIDDALYTFEPTLYEPSLRALAQLGTPTADQAIRRALRSAASDRARGYAAWVLSASADPKLVPLFIGLNQARTREARVEAIRALGRIPGDESTLMRMAYLPQTDPEIKLEATRTLDANDDAQARKLMWSAVNEPSDAVRLESLRRLAASAVGASREAGLKGVTDDSVGVRIALLEAWTAEPAPDVLPAIRAALADASPRVRAAALGALGASADAVEAKDVPFDDPDPRVRAAAIALARKKGVSIPVGTTPGKG